MDTQDDMIESEETITPETSPTDLPVEQAAPVAESPKQEAIAAPKVGSRKREFTGKVVSSKPDKTIVLAIERQIQHPLYKKYFKRVKKLMAHDETNSCGVGDVVRVRESRPLSARKRWTLVEIIQRAQ